MRIEKKRRNRGLGPRLWTNSPLFSCHNCSKALAPTRGYILIRVWVSFVQKQCVYCRGIYFVLVKVSTLKLNGPDFVYLRCCILSGVFLYLWFFLQHPIIKFLKKRIQPNLFFKRSYLKSNFGLTLAVIKSQLWTTPALLDICHALSFFYLIESTVKSCESSFTFLQYTNILRSLLVKIRKYKTFDPSQILL